MSMLHVSWYDEVNYDSMAEAVAVFGKAYRRPISFSVTAMAADLGLPSPASAAIRP